MATGIVSIAAYLEQMETIAWMLFILNIGAYIVLWAITIMRLIWFLPSILADLRSHSRGPALLTAVAATCILGNQFLVLGGQVTPAVWLLGFGAALWVCIMYAFFAAITVHDAKPDLEGGLNGGWLLTVVSTQAVALLGTMIASHMGSMRDQLTFVALCLFLVGCMLYILVISLIFYRWTFFRLMPAALTPPYWINMGAVAITTRVGATLAASPSHSPFLHDILPFLKGFTLFFWATGTWWIPLLVILTIWRHLSKIPVRYDPQYWGMVFPLGMYTVCTYQLSRMTGMPFLDVIPRLFVFVAIGAWAVTFAAMVHSVVAKALASIGPVQHANGAT
jgi:tellurite resistance protein TehA-like permease